MLPNRRSKEYSMSHERILDRERSLLLIIDLQEAYRGNLFQEERVMAASTRLLEAASVLGIPVLLTEQYPKGLGRTRDEIEAQLPPDTERFEKTTFSVAGVPPLLKRLHELERDQIVVAGIETHVCISQSVHDLLDLGYRVHVVRDAITSRFTLEDEAAWSKLTGSGAIPSSVEAVLFEWLRDSRAPEFKKVHRLVV
jgi:nicotinamidase-related amidase